MLLGLLHDIVVTRQLYNLLVVLVRILVVGLLVYCGLRLVMRLFFLLLLLNRLFLFLFLLSYIQCNHAFNHLLDGLRRCLYLFKLLLTLLL